MLAKLPSLFLLLRSPPTLKILSSTPCTIIWRQFPILFNITGWRKFPPLPITPCAFSAGKLRKVADMETPTVLYQLSSLTMLINSRSDTLEKMVSGNSVVISEMKKAVQENTKHITAVKESFDAVCVELNDMKGRIADFESQLEQYKANAETQEKCISHLENYSRRWDLKLYGLPEREKQDVGQEVIKVCRTVLPEEQVKFPDVVDTVHRIGPKKSNNNNQPRGVIIQFTSRIYCDDVWRAAKKSAFLKNNNLKLAEDLSPDDRARRNKLWPAVEATRKANKLAFFVAGRAFVEGKEIFPPL
ncbi:uncharacterized protein [Nothobranchius furzeri]|uniref:uncharacterized protein n=1 Tax=Nothobranchius furzeri TaxID=105023 RepID=UPI003904A901